MKFFIKDFFSKCDQIHSFQLTWESLNGKLHFLCRVHFTKLSGEEETIANKLCHSHVTILAISNF